MEDAFDGLVSKDSQLSNKPELEEMKTETAKAEKQNKTGWKREHIEGLQNTKGVTDTEQEYQEKNERRGEKKQLKKWLRISPN